MHLMRAKEINAHLGPHGSTLEYLEINNAGIIFPYYQHTDLWNYLWKIPNGPIPHATRFKWIKQALEAFIFIHLKGVLQGDITANNFIATNDAQSIVLCGFSGSKIGEKSFSGFPLRTYGVAISGKQCPCYGCDGTLTPAANLLEYQLSQGDIAVWRASRRCHIGHLSITKLGH